jgi:hypothetical protein
LLLHEGSLTLLLILLGHFLVNRDIALSLSGQAVRMTVMFMDVVAMAAFMVLVRLLMLLMGLLFLVVMAALRGMMRYRSRCLDISQGSSIELLTLFWINDNWSLHGSWCPLKLRNLGWGRLLNITLWDISNLWLQEFL